MFVSAQHLSSASSGGHVYNLSFWQFIDGDHRVECIRADYEALKACPVGVFDDYYVPDARGVTVDLAKYGANAVVAELEHYGAKVEILPAADPCKHGGVIKLAVVRR